MDNQGPSENQAREDRGSAKYVNLESLPKQGEKQ